MLERLATVTYLRRRLVLALAAVVVAVAAGWGTGVFGSLVGGGFDDPGSDSYRTGQALDGALGRDGADVVVLYRSETATVEDPVYAGAVTAALRALPPADVVRADSFFTTGSPALVSADRRATYAAVQLAGGTEDARTEAFERVRDTLAAWPGAGLTVALGGEVPVFASVSEQVSEDIARAEAISLPVLGVLLLVVFGGLAAASLPLVIGALAVLGAFTALRLITLVTDVSIFSVNIVTLLGLGLAIDYALFVVSRFREELPRSGGDVHRALIATMTTAGRTVLFSGVTVAVSLSGLLVFPQVFLRSMGYGGIAAVLVAMVAALTVLPALLAVLGPRVDALSLRRFRPRRGRRTSTGAAAGPAVGGAAVEGAAVEGAAVEGAAWARVARSVMRRPVVYAVLIVGVLLALGTPFLRVSPGTPDARVLPAGSEPRVVSEVLDRDFTRNATAPVTVAVTTDGPVTSSAGRAAVSAYADQLRGLPGVTGVRSFLDLPTGAPVERLAAGSTARIDVGYAAGTQSEAAQRLVSQIQALPTPAGVTVGVTGQTAALVDLLDSLRTLLPLMLLVIVLATFALLFLAFGSVVLPAKAVVMNVLSLSASFGALVWIFQDGRGADLLGFTSTGSIDATQPILMLAIAFGLSMDYEVFLLSRIKEAHDAGMSNTDAVAAGLARTGRIITSAAVLLVVVIGAFSTSGITFIKMIGVGMVIAILVDATVVRALLVPATMRLLGERTWWAPAPLRRFHARFGISEGGPAPTGSVAVAVAVPEQAGAALAPASARH